MSLLKIIDEALKNNPEVYVGNIKRIDHLHDYKACENTIHIVEYLISPKTGIFNARALQNFMIDIIPQELKSLLRKTANADYCFRNIEDGNIEYYNENNTLGTLNFGYISFYEKIGSGKTTKELTIIEPEDFNIEGLPGKWVESQEYILQRDIRIHVYPCEQYIADLLDNKLPVQGRYEIRINDLGKYVRP